MTGLRVVNLVAERLNRGLSLAAAAETIGVARATLLRAEGGIAVRPDKAKLIADFYGCEVTDIYKYASRVADAEHPFPEAA